MPITVKAVTVMDYDGFYNIYVNARINCEQQKKAIAHELTHIARGDFFKSEPLETVESM